MKRDFRPGQSPGSPIARATFGATSIVANVFDGGPRTGATMKIGDRAAAEMTRKTMAEPLVGEVFERNEATRKPWVKAELPSHMWSRARRRICLTEPIASSSRP